MRGVFLKRILSGENNNKMIRISVKGIIGYAAAAELLKQHRQELEARFSRRFIREFEQLADINNLVPEDFHLVLTVPIGEGGLFGTLWKLCEQLEIIEDGRFKGSVGLRADLDKVPLDQKVTEICELYGEDPYETVSPEACIIVWDDCRIDSDTFENMMSCTAEIGYITDDNKRILYNGEQIRYLTPPERQLKDIVDRKQHY